jgi:hypothetical protein
VSVLFADLVGFTAASQAATQRRRGSSSPSTSTPFVGRDRELRQRKELFHVSADEQKTHLVSVTGMAGIGKSRLAWEFYEYIDAIAGTIYRHRGRCLSYGEGVTYWGPG